MTSRERILCALNGKEPDRVACAMNFYRIEPEDLLKPNQFHEEMVDIQFIDLPALPEEEALFDKLEPYDADTRLGTKYQIANYQRWNYDIEKPDTRNPLSMATSLEDLKSFSLPEELLTYNIDYLSDQVKALHKKGMAAGGNMPHLGGELFETAWRLRGLENFLIDLIKRPDWVEYLLNQLTIMAKRASIALAKAGVDVIALDDDIGMPKTMIISPDIWRKFFKPRMAEIISAARAVKPDLHFIYHSDGYFEPVIGDLMDIGFQAINPVQPDHMDALRIRKRFGPKLAFWGTVGTQSAFSFNTPEEIKKEVKLRIETLGTAGLIICPAYDIDEPDIPWTNIAAFLEAVKLYG
ncbi:MAG: hypothetical protein K9L30_06780 [Desulfobacterales bacterium]|nr:hypothetical protein [Desulfobacterales bacterium]